ncbi:MAG: hypothetical protein J0M12_16955, partial [Deltaproteobacteria bacterium]|nr:hypothetical protein [Deltaproteobacteria bacterium]
DIFRVMSREMRELYPHAVLVRRNGGNLVVLTPNAGKLADLEDFERRVNNVMTGASGDRYERAVAEHEQRVALREFFGLVEEKGRAAVANATVAAADIRSAYQTLPIRVEFVSDPVKVTLQAHQTFGELFESLFG